jgi:hypothetical protein
MLTVPELAADALGDFLGTYMRRRFGSSQTHLVEMVPSIARIAIECIGNSDALYHNVEHTLLVTLAGHDILRGRALHTHMPAEDYAHVIIACLTHDIGYIHGLFRDDDADGFVVDSSGRKVQLPRGASDAALLPYHVDRSKLYVMERIEGIAMLDKRRIARAVEGTRIPASVPSEDEECDEEASILRAADLIGQLGDPHYIRKANALWFEFEEAGLNRQLGYDSPADIVHRYPQLYWNSVAPHVQTAIRYLNVTSSGASGSPISTATCSAPSATSRCRGRRRKPGCNRVTPSGRAVARPFALDIQDCANPLAVKQVGRMMISVLDKTVLDLLPVAKITGFSKRNRLLEHFETASIHATNLVRETALQCVARSNPDHL